METIEVLDKNPRRREAVENIGLKFTEKLLNCGSPEGEVIVQLIYCVVRCVWPFFSESLVGTVNRVQGEDFIRAAAPSEEVWTYSVLYPLGM